MFQLRTKWPANKKAPPTAGLHQYGGPSYEVMRI